MAFRCLGKAIFAIVALGIFTTNHAALAQGTTALQVSVLAGEQDATPVSIIGLHQGLRIEVDDEDVASKEVVVVSSVSRNGFHAKFAHGHPAGTILIFRCQTPASSDRPEGTITVGCPKVWRSDRVFTVLDGLLRDVDSITVRALPDLDPNAANTAFVESLLTDLQIKAKYDQAAAVNNSSKLEQLKAQRKAELASFQRKQEANDTLSKSRAVLQNELLEMDKQELELVKKGTIDPEGTTDDAKKLKNIRAQKQTITAQITDIDTTMAANDKQTISDAGLTSTAATDTGEAKAGTPLAAIPDEFKRSIKDALRQPTLPASMQMDNVIELLHERLAREFSVMYDDLSRQTKDYDLYLLQFDVGVLPKHDSKYHEAQVWVSLGVPGALAYELYPSASAYNTLHALDKTNRFGISGVAQTLFGFGLSAAFTREHNELRSSLSQAMYMSGFGAGTGTFGWRIGPAPFEDFVNPGTRIVHAVLLVPKGATSVRSIHATVGYCWPRRETHSYWWTSFDDACGDSNTSSQRDIGFDIALPGKPTLTLTSFSYQPVDATLTTEGAPDPKQTNTLQLSFEEPVDPNLTVTAGDKIIRRVRDVRGRAMVVPHETITGNKEEQAAIDGSRFGLLEKDTLDEDTWLQVNSRTILLNISEKTAGTDSFPVIRLSDPGADGQELSDLLGKVAPNAQDRNDRKARIGEWKFEGATLATLPENAFLPMFLRKYEPGRIVAYVDSIESGYPARLRIISQTRRAERANPVWLHDHAQTVLVGETDSGSESDRHWPFTCNQEEGTLLCRVPQEARSLNYTRFKVWVDEPPYDIRPGLWADHDVVMPAGGWQAEAYPFTQWSDVQVGCQPGHDCPPEHPWDAWHARLRMKPKDSTEYCIVENLHQRVTEHSQHKAERLLGAQLKGANLFENRYTSSSDREFFCQGPDVGVRTRQLDFWIPFAALPIVRGHLHLGERCRCSARDTACQNHCQNSGRPTVELPDLGLNLLPGPVTLTPLGEESFRLEANLLESVDSVRLESPGQILPVPASTGYNSLDFNVRGKRLKRDCYNVFLVVGRVTVPAKKEDEKKKLVQLRLPYEGPPGTKTDSTPLDCDHPKPVGEEPANKSEAAKQASASQQPPSAAKPSAGTTPKPEPSHPPRN